MDLVDLTKELTQFRLETIPALKAAADSLIDDKIPKLTGAIERIVDSADRHIDEDMVQLVGSINGLAQTFVDDLHEIVSRLNGATITITIKIPPRKS